MKSMGRKARDQTSNSPEREPMTSTKQTGSQALKTKDSNTILSSRQQTELNGIIEKVKARPGKPKSLYILRRETPADDGVIHTRSGRVSLKPLAYWRNEKCVFGGSPASASLQDGARYPLNSIKEIIRTEEVQAASLKKYKKSKEKSKKGQGRAKSKVDEAEMPSESESDEDEETADPNAEPWESEVGTFRGAVSLWDAQQQQPLQDEEDVDIAYAPAAIQTREVKGSSFRYAKLLSTKFFGTGIVDLPPGSVKRPKNSRKMHMSFFVATGRVTVQVGPVLGQESRFSVGKGGFWQVPRGKSRKSSPSLCIVLTLRHRESVFD